VTEKVEFSSEVMNKIKQSAMNFKDSIANFFKGHSVEIKDWKFAVECTSESGCEVDVSVKYL
jgi:hypothetical protein